MNIIRGLAYFAAVTTLSIVVLTQTNPNAIASFRTRLLQEVYFPNEFPAPAETYALISVSKGIYSFEEVGDYTGTDWEAHYAKKTDFSTEAAVATSNNGGNQEYPVDDDIIAVIFRGTEELDDWVVDFDFELVSCVIPGCPDGAKVHSGFSDSLFDNENIIYEVEDAVKSILDDSEFQGDKSTIYVTGHSLGGALAQLCAIYLAQVNPDMNVKMINFGAPRIGNQNFAEWADELSNLSAWRFVNDFDTIPRTPANTLGYEHSGHLMDMKRGRCRAYYRQDGGNGYAGVYNSWYYSGLNPTDHLSSNYRTILRNKQDKPDYWPANFE